MLVVLVILAVLMSIAVGSYLGAQATAKDSAAKNYLNVAFRGARENATDNAGRYGTPSEIRSLIEANSAELLAVIGRDSSAAIGAPKNAVIIDSDDTTGTALTIYVRSESGSVWRLDAPPTGQHIISKDPGYGSPLYPTIISQPTVPASFDAGDTISVSQGSWTNTPGGYAYQWIRCAPDGNNCVLINGATSSSYTTTLQDVGRSLRAVVTASNANGSNISFSTPSGSGGAPVLPAVGTSPSVSDGNDNIPVEGETLTASPGTWSGSGSTTYAYQWQSSPDGSTWSNIGGATATTYLIPSGRIGDQLRVRVTATNLAGSNSAPSNGTSAVYAAAPLNTVAPGAPTGSAAVGSTLTRQLGSWASSVPINYSFQWQRCNPSCSNISGATGTTYTPVGGDAGYTIRTIVTATNTSNGGLATAANSAQTATVVNPPPVVDVCCSQTGPQGTPINVSWTSSNATSCSGDLGSGLSGGNGVGGPATPAGTYVYSMTCSGPGGSSSDSVTIVFE
jgi:type II secretory pathway pseudopilin PulG